MSRLTSPLLFVAVVGLAAVGADPPAPRYITVPVSKLELTEGKLPDTNLVLFLLDAQIQQQVLRWGIAEKQGRMTVTVDGKSSSEMIVESRGATPTWDQVFLAIQAKGDGPITGRIDYDLGPDSKERGSFKFRVPANANTTRAAAWYRYGRDSRLLHQRTPLEQGAPGAAWFRHRIDQIADDRPEELKFMWQTARVNAPRFRNEPRPRVEAKAAIPEAPADDQRPTAVAMEPDWRRVATLDLPEREPPARARNQNWRHDYTELLSGGRAISENLQLDRAMLVRDANEAPVPLANITGITVREYNWAPLVKDKKPALDALAAFIPSDQHALFFPSVAASAAVMQEVDQMGMAIFHLAAADSRDDRLGERYRTQLAVPGTELGKLIPKELVPGLAMTGGDLYFDTGTDVAVLLATEQPAAVSKLLKAGWMIIKAKNPDAVEGQETVAEIECKTLRSPDRRVCAYLAELPGFVLLTNSPAQIRRIADVRANKSPALASLQEYTFFRDRYPKGEEEAGFAILPDAAIRRWCGPQWRIAHHRRLITGSALASAQAAHLVEMRGMKEPRSVDLPALGPAEVTARGVYAPAYGSRLFQTPISEMDLEHVTAGEADAYNRWRDTYQQNWSQFFDPVAMQIVAKPERLAVDVTVWPLIANTQYREFSNWAIGAKLAPGAGDPHPEALAHLVVGFNRESENFKQLMNQGRGLLDGKVTIESWLGDWVTVYADEDPLWEDFAKHKNDPLSFWEKQSYQVPVAVGVNVRDSLKLALFITALRTIINQSAPNMVTFENAEHNGIGYLKLKPTRALGPNADFQLFSVTLPDQWILTPNPRVAHRAIDRYIARKDGTTKPATAAWVGDGVAFYVKPKALSYLDDFWIRHGTEPMQEACFANIPILNEWHALDPATDPVAFHEKWWGERLTCPAGGKYVWNEADQTMESTVLGHPRQPKSAVGAIPPALKAIKDVAMGVTFERDGIRAKVDLKRGPDTAAKNGAAPAPR